MPPEPAVLRIAYHLTLELARRVERFPRSHRVGVGADLTRHARDLLADLVRARYARPADCRHHLRHVNLGLDLLRYSLRLAADLRALPLTAHGHLIRLADDVGRQVGGWLRSLPSDGGGR